MPRRLVGRETEVGLIPARIAPVFRDREELPTATDLGHVVNAALVGQDEVDNGIVRNESLRVVLCGSHDQARDEGKRLIICKRGFVYDRTFRSSVVRSSR